MRKKLQVLCFAPRRGFRAQLREAHLQRQLTGAGGASRMAPNLLHVFHDVHAKLLAGKDRKLHACLHTHITLQYAPHIPVRVPAAGECATAGRGRTHAKLVNVGIVADPGQVLPHSLAQRHVFDVGVFMAKVMRATDVETGEGGQAAQDGKTRRRLRRVSLATKQPMRTKEQNTRPPRFPCAPSRHRRSARPHFRWM